MAQLQLIAKIFIDATLTVVTGLHIGTSDDFAPIGGLDSPFIRDPFTKRPIIPGSSVKGKMRALLEKVRDKDSNEKYKDVVKRLFGSAQIGNDRSSKSAPEANPSKSSEQGGNDRCAIPSRLQFVDSFVTDSYKKFSSLETDTYLGEIKAENSIDRSSGVANPRFIERVPAGMEFKFHLVYNLENGAEYHDDMDALIAGLSLLQMDYLGGHGSRGYGRVHFSNFNVNWIDVDTGEKIEENDLKEKLTKACENNYFGPC